MIDYDVFDRPVRERVQPQQSAPPPIGTLGSIVGGLAGAMFGGPAGVGIGSSVGGMIGKGAEKLALANTPSWQGKGPQTDLSPIDQLIQTLSRRKKGEPEETVGAALGDYDSSDTGSNLA